MKAIQHHWKVPLIVSQYDIGFGSTSVSESLESESRSSKRVTDATRTMITVTQKWQCIFHHPFLSYQCPALKASKISDDAVTNYALLSYAGNVFRPSHFPH